MHDPNPWAGPLTFLMGIVLAFTAAMLAYRMGRFDERRELQITRRRVLDLFDQIEMLRQFGLRIMKQTGRVHLKTHKGNCSCAVHEFIFLNEELNRSITAAKRDGVLAPQEPVSGALQTVDRSAFSDKED